MKEKLFKIFVDFDGTITKEDVGESIFRRFGNEPEVNKITDDLLDDKISAKDCWISLCNSISSVNAEEFDLYINQKEIDDTFHNFVNYCRKNQIEFFVLSDGFDYYIDKIFEKEKLKRIKYFSNKLIIKNGKLMPEFPYEDPDCSSSANCKRNHIINNSGDEEYTIYIGDGNSDKYTSQFCDFIFAKSDLLKFCERERISYFPFNNFIDVIEKIEILRSKRNLKKRHQAELKRREVYIRE